MVDEANLARGVSLEQAAQLADEHDVSRAQSGYKIGDLIRSLVSTDAAQALAAHDTKLLEDVLRTRCMAHRDVPQLNKADHGQECPICYLEGVRPNTSPIKPICPHDSSHPVEWAVWIDEYICAVCKCTIPEPSKFGGLKIVAGPAPAKEDK